LLFENGGHIELTKSWAKSLLKRMNMVKRKGTTSKKTFVVENFMQEKDKYLKSIESKVEMYKIPGAKWLVKLYDHLCTNPAIIRNGFSGSCGISEILSYKC
jgi:hypothetical protein